MAKTHHAPTRIASTSFLGAVTAMWRMGDKSPVSSPVSTANAAALSVSWEKATFRMTAK